MFNFFSHINLAAEKMSAGIKKGKKNHFIFIFISRILHRRVRDAKNKK
jgi:hypothetical protein